MAKFTKLNIGEAVASSGGRGWKKLSSVFQLTAPTLSLDGDMLTITDDSGLATSFDILANGEVKGTATSENFDLSTLKFADGTYSITVIAKADGYIDSAESEAVSYEAVNDELAGTWLFNDVLTRPDSNFQIYSNNSTVLFSGGGSTTYWKIYSAITSSNWLKVAQSGFISVDSVYGDNGWLLPSLKTIVFEPIIDDLATPAFTNWLKANATKII